MNKFAVVKLNNKEAEIYEWRDYKDYGFEWYNWHDNNGNYMPQAYMHESNTRYCLGIVKAKVIKLEMNHRHFLLDASNADGEAVQCQSCNRDYDVDDYYIYEGSSVNFNIDCVCGEKVKGTIEPAISTSITYK